MDFSVLKKLGLSTGEIKIYGILIHTGATSLNNIHQNAGIDRRNIYDILNKLIEKGLISYIEENGKRTFKATNPDRLLSYVEEKKTHLDHIKKEVEQILPGIKTIYDTPKEELFASIYRGAEGLKAAWDDMLHYDEILWIGSGNYVPERFPVYFNNWNKKRNQLGVQSHHLFRYEKKKELKKETVTNYKVLPPEFSKNPSVIAVYGNKVAQMLLGENLTVFVTESKELAENYKAYYTYLRDHVAK